MRLGKLLLAVVAAAVLFGAFVASASARNLSFSEQRVIGLWTQLRFTGGFGTVECEIKMSRSIHSRTFTKTFNSLIGYVTEATVLRCSSGGMTINQASFPWHLRFLAFLGTLPNLTGERGRTIGVEWTLREPVFGITCTVRATEAGEIIYIYTISSGTVTREEITSEGSRCGGVAGSLSGTTTNVTASAGARVTLLLI